MTVHLWMHSPQMTLYRDNTLDILIMKNYHGWSVVNLVNICFKDCQEAVVGLFVGFSTSDQCNYACEYHIFMTECLDQQLPADFRLYHRDFH